MTNSSYLFDVRLPAFEELQAAPWGRIHYSVSFANVQRHIDQRPLRVLDVGGGNGLDAIAFAAQGHSITLLDFSAEMLTAARHNAEASGVAQRITFYQADLAAIPTLFPDAAFDVILCHNVLQFVENVGATLKAACHALLPGGLISLMGTNRYSEVYRQILQQLDPVAAYGSLDATSAYSPTFDVPIRIHAAEELHRPLHEAGCSVVSEYGVRCVCDYVPNNDIKRDPTFFSQLERLELAMSDRYPYYLLARLFQIIARKDVM